MTRTPNDQRSDAKNPTSSDHQKMLDNRSVQIEKTQSKEEAAPRVGMPEQATAPAGNRKP